MARRHIVILAGLVGLGCGPLQAGDFVGRVLDPEGRPAAGAEVYALGFRRDRDLIQSAPVRADAQGRWRVRDPRADVLVLAVALTAHAVGMRSPEEGGLVIRLAATVPCEGKVTDPRGRPVAGATVKAMQAGGGPSFMATYYLAMFPAGPLAARLSATSGPDGTFTLPHTLPDAPLQLQATCPGYFANTAFGQPGQAPRVVLWPEAAVRGRVVDARGKPLAGVFVTAIGSAFAHDLTNVDGSYRLEGLRAGMQAVAARSPSPALAPAVLTGLYAAGHECTQLPDLVLTPGVLVHIKLIDASSGKPVGPAGVAIWGRAMYEGVSVGRNGSGQIRLPPMKGYAMATAVPHGYTARRFVGKDEQSGVFELKPGEREHTVVLQAGRRRDVRGIVLDDQNRPVSEAAVMASTDRPETVITDAHGRFTLHNVPSFGIPWYVRVEGMGIRCDRPYQLPDVSRLKQPAVVRVKSAPAEPLTGRVTDPWGHGLADVVVTLAWSVETADDYLDGARRRRTDARGVYRFGRVEPSAALALSARRAGWQTLRGGGVRTEGGLRVEDLVLARPVAMVRGQVLDAAGKPAAGARVFCLEAADRQTLCGADGRFALRGLPVAPLRLVALQGRFGRGQVGALPGADVVVRVAAWKPLTSEEARRRALLVLRRAAGCLDRQYPWLAGPALGRRALLDPAAAHQSAAAMPAERQRGQTVAAALEWLAINRPERVRDVLGLVELIPTRAERGEICAVLAGILPASERDLTAELYVRADTDGWPARAQRSGAAGTMLCLAAAAGALGEDDAPEIVDRALEFALGAGGDPAGVLAHRAGLVARHPALFDRLLAGLSDTRLKRAALASAVRELAASQPEQAVARWRQIPPPAPPRPAPGMPGPGGPPPGMMMDPAMMAQMQANAPGAPGAPPAPGMMMNPEMMREMARAGGMWGGVPPGMFDPEAMDGMDEEADANPDVQGFRWPGPGGMAPPALPDELDRPFDSSSLVEVVLGALAQVAPAEAEKLAHEAADNEGPGLLTTLLLALPRAQRLPRMARLTKGMGPAMLRYVRLALLDTVAAEQPAVAERWYRELAPTLRSGDAYAAGRVACLDPNRAWWMTELAAANMGGRLREEPIGPPGWVWMGVGQGAYAGLLARVAPDRAAELADRQAPGDQRRVSAAVAGWCGIADGLLGWKFEELPYPFEG